MPLTPSALGFGLKLEISRGVGLGGRPDMAICGVSSVVDVGWCSFREGMLLCCPKRYFDVVGLQVLGFVV
jgi:hypothetical protein